MTSVDDLAALANLDTSLMPSHLTIDDIASLFAVSGRAALIAKLRAAGLAAGHAGKWQMRCPNVFEKAVSLD